jgi:hypothetical protein
LALFLSCALNFLLSLPLITGVGEMGSAISVVYFYKYTTFICLVYTYGFSDVNITLR